MAQTKKRRSKEDLLQCGLGIVSRLGPDKLTIEALCRELAVTKGSFYHHFENREAYVRELLDFWFETYGRRLVDQSVQEETAHGRLWRTVSVAMRQPYALDVAIRAWGARDPAVGEYVRRMDAMRLDNLIQAMRPFAASDEAAGKMARACYAAHLGSKVIRPAFDEALYLELVETMCDALGLPRFMDSVADGKIE